MERRDVCAGLGTSEEPVLATKAPPRHRRAAIVAVLCTVGWLVAGTLGLVSAASASPSPRASAPTGNGYYLVASDGGVFSYGPGATYYGSTGGKSLVAPIVGMASSSIGGYYLVASDGGVFAFGPPFYGSMGGKSLVAPIVGMAAVPGGNGYYLVASDGGVFAFGPDAPFYGSMGGKSLVAPIVGIAAAPTGNGYYLVASDGGIFAFGPGAPFYGSTGGEKLSRPVVGMADAPTGNGYYLVASDGGIFAFGPGAPFYGSTGGEKLSKPVVGMADAPTGNGYYLVASDGGVFAFGPGAPFYGSTGGGTLSKPVVGVASVLGSVSTSNSHLTLTVNDSRSTVPADGMTQDTISASATNSSGQFVAGDVFTLSTSGSACGTVSPTSATQGSSGPATFLYTASTTSGSCSVTVRESDFSLSVSLLIDQAPVAVLTASDNQAQVTAHVGDWVEIQLSDCTSCGYQWNFIPPAPNSGVLAYQGETTENPGAGSGQAGGNVTDVFTFEVVGTGNTSVSLGYFPPGSNTPSSTWTASFTVN